MKDRMRNKKEDKIGIKIMEGRKEVTVDRN